nr:restriction endonuclease subunit S [Bifidobacterium bifidum]
MVTGTTSPSTRYERISVSPASCSIKSEYVIASHAFKPQYKCINYIPAWEQRKLGELVVIERGGSPRPIDEYITDDTNGLNWVKIGDAPSLGRYISKTSEKIKPEGLSKTRQVHPGDLILSNSMSFGRPYIMAIEGCIHDGWLLIRDEPKSFDPMYLCHMLGTPKMLNQYRMLASGSTVNNLNKELVSNASILMPCKSEQKVIGQFFNHLDDLITLHQRKRESRIIRVRSFIWLAGDISGIGVSAYQPEKRRLYDRRQHQRRNVVLRLLRAMDQRIQGRCNS